MRCNISVHGLTATEMEISTILCTHVALGGLCFYVPVCISVYLEGESSFYRASYASAVLGVVVLSVCPSVTRVLCD